MNNLYRFNQVFKQTNLIYYTYAKQHHLSLTDFWIFYYLRLENKPLTQSDMQMYVLLPKQTIHSAIHVLEKKGYVEFIPSTTKKKYFQLTEEGMIFTDSFIPYIMQAEEKALQSLENTEVYLTMEEIYKKELETTLWPSN
ncbi:MAG: MarR family transcriptional regulator [Bulleidia sp.]|nr:MarR family transcriptional regulator [Bulleidia sp.]